MTSQVTNRRPKSSEEGVALIVAITTVAILAVMLADMHQTTGTAFAVSTAQRDALQAEYLAKSATNLTRLLTAKEPEIRRFVNPLYQAATGRAAPQLPVWDFANAILSPFCTPEDQRDTLTQLGVDFGDTTGFDGIPGTCNIVVVSENGKINLNDPLFLDGERARNSVAVQLFSLTGGYQPDNPYDFLFSNQDENGNITTRQDVVSAVIDWWDRDIQRTDFDPGAATTRTGGTGTEDDSIYQLYGDSYRNKNAPFDSIQELRLVRGFSDDFWATFVEPVPNDPESRIVTIYASGLVNVNEANPQVLLARLCGEVPETTLCADPLEAIKFTQILSTVRMLIPIPLFTQPADFIGFIEGKSGSKDLYGMLQGFLGEESELLFVPVELTEAQREVLGRTFATAARIFTIVATGQVGNSQVRIESVVNFHERWVPPPPNAGRMPGLGVFHYYRVN
ncbi:MAG: type II secretion system protein GspK [Myxococcales bacterium]|nr:type II secretion system protein GspK [Myxococcales bacterium]MDH3485511.1 type II secretion system protein GspK [Myxococcales bacterium]